MTKHRDVVLYFNYEDILGAAFEQFVRDGIADQEAEAWVKDSSHCSLVVGSYEVGEVIGVRIDSRAQRVGMTIEWRSEIEVVSLL